MSISPENDPYLAFDALIAAAPDDEPAPAIPSNIIPIRQGDENPSVNARDLHTFLEVGKDFSNWIKDRIDSFGFTAGEDYSPISANRSDGLPGKARIDYLLSLDMAKELSMVERTPRGKQARQYFIECEKNLAAASANPLASLSDPAALRTLLLGYAEKVIGLEQQVETLAPKAAGLERLAGTAGTYCITDAAKSLGVSPKRLFEFMEARQWIYRRGGEWLPMQSKQNAGLMDCKVVSFQASDGARSTTQARVTAKGLARLSELLTA
jgi:phage anti-repressor protein/phage antirepressor YoqD-like protein